MQLRALYIFRLVGMWNVILNLLFVDIFILVDSGNKYSALNPMYFLYIISIISSHACLINGCYHSF